MIQFILTIKMMENKKKISNITNLFIDKNIIKTKKRIIKKEKEL